MTAAEPPVRRNSPRRQSKTSTAPAQSSSSTANQNSAGTSDPYYGHEYTAKMAAAFITSLFSCPDLPPPSTALTASGQPVPSPKLAHFIAYALHRTRLSSSVTFASLFLLQRLKARFPAARGSSGHRLFISAFMIASKVVCDDTYSNKSWCVVGQGMFSLREINQMEREMCSYLEWVLNVQHLELEVFTEKVQAEFGSGAAPIVPVASNTSTATSVPTAPPAAVVNKVVVPAPTFKPRGPVRPDSPKAAAAYPPRGYANDSAEVSPGSDVEGLSHSETASPASSSPQTPPSNADDTAQVVVGSNVPITSSIPKMMATGGVVDSKVIEPRLSAFAAPAVW